MHASSHWRAWLAVGAALLAALAVVSWSRLNRPSGITGSRGEADRASARPDAALAPAEAESETASTPPERASLAPESPTPEATAATRPAHVDEITIEVVDAATDAPVAGAEVVYRDLGPDATPEERRAIHQPAELDALLAGGSAVERTTDASGRARVPAPRGSGVAIARKDQSFGFASFDDRGLERVRIRIAPDWSLPIQVVDAAGRPVVGVPVALRQRGAWRIEDPVVARTTAPDGIGLVPHAGARMAAAKATGIWLAAVDAVLREPLEREIDPGAPPAEPVRFVLPDSGAAVVELREADGELSAGAALVWLEATPADASVFTTSALASGGKARFDFVELGLDLRASASRLGVSSRRVETAGPGPRSAGEAAELVLSFGGGGAVLEAQVVRPDGAPVARRQLRASMRAGETMVELSVLTGADGRFRVDHAPDLAARGELALSVRDRASGRSSAGVRVPANLGPGIHDLGALVLGSAPVAAAGVVVDATGAPVPRAEVRLQVQRVQERGGERTVSWQVLSEVEARSGGDGSFELQAEVDAAKPLLVTARRDGYAAAGVECARGAADVRIVLARGGSIAGRVLADERMAVDKMTVEIVDPARPSDRGAWALRSRWTSAPEPSGRFEVDDLPAGSYSLSVRASGNDPTPLAQLDGLVVAAGEPCADPRLAEIDVRGAVAGITLRIVDREGARVPKGAVRVEASGGGSARIVSFLGGELRLVRAPPVVDLVVQANGYRAARLEGVSGDREVVLEPGIRVRLVQADPSRFPGKPVRMRPLLRPVAGRTDALTFDCPDLDERGEAVIEAPAPGKYEVDWLVQIDQALSTAIVNFAPKAKQVIEIADAPGEQRIELELDAETLAETLERLKD